LKKKRINKKSRERKEMIRGKLGNARAPNATSRNSIEKENKRRGRKLLPGPGQKTREGKRDASGNLNRGGKNSERKEKNHYTEGRRRGFPGIKQIKRKRGS